MRNMRGMEREVRDEEGVMDGGNRLRRRAGERAIAHREDQAYIKTYLFKGDFYGLAVKGVTRV